MLLIVQIEQAEPQMLNVLLGLGVGFAVWTLLLWAAGIFQPGRIVGPERYLIDEHPLAPLPSMMLALGVWIMLPAFYGIWAQARRGTTQPGTIKFSAAELATLSTIAPVAALAAMLALDVLMRRDAWRLIGLQLRRFGAGLLTGMAGIALAMPLVFLAAWITEWYLTHRNIEHPKVHEMLQTLGQTPEWWLKAIIVVAAVIVAPLFEETFFRGHLQTLLGRIFAKKRPMAGDPAQIGTQVVMTDATGLPVVSYVVPMQLHTGALGRWAAVIVTSLLFTAVHPWWSMPAIFALSVCLGYAYERTGNLWTSIVMHALFNGLQTLIFLFEFSNGQHH